MTAIEIIARFQPLMPEGIRFGASYPIAPWEDSDGNWHQPSDTEALIRISTRERYVDGLIEESDLAWSDEMFRERIIVPMLAMLKDPA